MNRTIEYLKRLKEDMTHSIEQEDSSIQVDSNDLRHIDEALEDIRCEQKKFEQLHDELIGIAISFRAGRVGELTDSVLIDKITSILKRY